MDKKIANNLIVGIFVMVGFGGFLYVLFNISGGRGIFSNDYPIYAKFHHVKGLNYGSEVSLVGLRIGTVRKILVSDTPEKELITELAISREMMDRIKEDSVATIKTSGVLGDKYIELSIGSPSAPVLKAGSYIRAEEPADIVSKTGDLMGGLSEYFKKGGDLELLLKNLNQVALNLSTITAEMREGKGLLAELSHGESGHKFSKATGHLEDILRKINNGDGTIGALINDPTVYEDLKSMLAGAKRSSVLKYFMRSFIEDGKPEEKKK